MPRRPPYEGFSGESTANVKIERRPLTRPEVSKKIAETVPPADLLEVPAFAAGQTIERPKADGTTEIWTIDQVGENGKLFLTKGTDAEVMEQRPKTQMDSAEAVRELQSVTFVPEVAKQWDAVLATAKELNYSEIDEQTRNDLTLEVAADIAADIAEGREGEAKDDLLKAKLLTAYWGALKEIDAGRYLFHQDKDTVITNEKNRVRPMERSRLMDKGELELVGGPRHDVYEDGDGELGMVADIAVDDDERTETSKPKQAGKLAVKRRDIDPAIFQGVDKNPVQEGLNIYDHPEGIKKEIPPVMKMDFPAARESALQKEREERAKTRGERKTLKNRVAFAEAAPWFEQETADLYAGKLSPEARHIIENPSPGLTELAQEFGLDLEHFAEQIQDWKLTDDQNKPITLQRIQHANKGSLIDFAFRPDRYRNSIKYFRDLLRHHVDKTLRIDEQAAKKAS